MEKQNPSSLNKTILELQNDLRDLLFVRPFDIATIETAAVKLCDAVIDNEVDCLSNILTQQQFSKMPIIERMEYMQVYGALCASGFQELTYDQLLTYKRSNVNPAIRFRKIKRSFNMKEIKLRPYVYGLTEPEEGQECVILINGNSYGTAVFENIGYVNAFVNESYDCFNTNMVTHYLPIIEIPN